MSTRNSTAPWVTVFKRELIVRGLNKAFIIGTVISVAALLVGGGITYMVSQDSASSIGVTDDAGAAVIGILNEHDVANDKDPSYEIVRVADQEEADSLLEEGDLDAALYHQSGQWSYAIKEFDSGALSEKMKFDQAVTQYTLAANASAQGIDMASLSQGSELALTTLDGQGEEGNDRAAMLWIVSIVFAALFFSTTLGFGIQIAQSVVEEKQSRIVEILISVIPARDLLLGKILANSLLALIQIGIYGGIGLLIASMTDLSLALPGLGYGVGWFIAFFIAAFLALSCIWAGAGAMATRQEDLGQTTMPLTMSLGAVYVVGFMAKGTWLAILSYIPIVSSALMPARVVGGKATWWEAAVSLAITMVFCLVAIWVGGKIYRRGIMRNKVLTYKDLLKRGA